MGENAKLEFHLKAQLVFIQFVGTHQEYDAINDVKNI
ncbi:MAG: hypothetical protein DYG98_12240 [Haliscomenobacteraceae bacterium CHB4]|nr:hypothetical protein [Haliscomenobacteraceae bacterium CHB4]